MVELTVTALLIVFAYSITIINTTLFPETLEEALKNGFQDSASYLSLWKCYLACHWRQERFLPLKTNGAEAHLDNNPLNVAFERSVNFINQNFGEQGDPTGS